MRMNAEQAAVTVSWHLLAKANTIINVNKRSKQN